MKTFLQLFTLLLVSNLVFAQQNTVQVPAPLKQVSSQTGMRPVADPTNSIAKAYKKMHSTRNPGDGDNWFNYANDYAIFVAAATGYYYTLPIFPDTNIIAYTFADTAGGNVISKKAVPTWHGAATVVDPYHFFAIQWPYNQFTIDSIAVPVFYLRRTDASVVDTMIITFFQPHAIDYAFIGPTKVLWEVASYDYLTRSVDSTDKLLQIKYPLTTFDSTLVAPGAGLTVNDVKYEYLPVSGLPFVDSNRVMGVAIQFKPGYTYSYANGDSLGGKNEFNILSAAEAANLVQTINDSSNYNYSYVLTTNAVYHDTADFFNTQFYPSVGLTPFGAQNHMISVHLIAYPLGVKELLIGNGLNFYPNPTREVGTLAYDLKNNAQKVSLKVFDLTGKQVLDIEKSAQSAGSHQIPVNTQTLVSGMYFYSFSVDGETANGKFIVD